jgi:hypothetical protein
MKIQNLPVIAICLVFSCSTQTPAVKNWFPDDIIHPPPIAEFIHNFSTDDIGVARNAYITLLAFIEEMTQAHYENIERAYRFDTPTVKCPALIDGKLIIVESRVPVSYHVRWDDELDEIIEIGPSGDVLGEITDIAYNNLLHNKLVDHWHSLTGELLGEHLDAQSTFDKLFQEHMSMIFPSVEKYIK